MEDPAARPQLNPTAMSLADAAKLLTAVGSAEVSVDSLRTDVGYGAPVNADGTLNLVHYAAWLVQELAGATGK
ncbi:hypothetical protein OAS39_07540 [Pirellulales bacterium]|nr:hypothetical protein [Pirellulales bacterium]